MIKNQDNAMKFQLASSMWKAFNNFLIISFYMTLYAYYAIHVAHEDCILIKMSTFHAGESICSLINHFVKSYALNY